MKKALSLLAIFCILLTCASAIGECEDVDRFVVGNPTPMRGEFFTEMWGNDTSDIDVRDLLHGYNLILWDDEDGMFDIDPSVVSGISFHENKRGDHIFILYLYDDLRYSDGTKITAWDYAFSFLLTMAPEIKEIGGEPLRQEHILGYQDYIDKKAPLAGVHVASDRTLIITLNHEYLPFFYEMGLLSCNPYPISVIAPGVMVKDDGEGVYLANIDPEIKEPIFTAELLAHTIMDKETGYMSHPSVVSGPYTITSWDGATAQFEINPYYKGNAKGQKPTIDHLTYTYVSYDSMVEQMDNGEFDLLDKVVRADKIKAMIQRMGPDNLAAATYPRIGLSYISFACEKEAMSSLAVRQAIAWCMDRDKITKDYVDAFGARVDSFFGIGQWMHGILAGTIQAPVEPPKDESDAKAMAEYKSRVDAYNALNLDELTVYTKDLDRARALLDQDGWTLNEDGIRQKEDIVLDLKLIYPESNNINEIFEKEFIPNLEQIGIRLTMEAVPMADLLSMWYQQDERDADMIYLASNLYIIFDPSAHFSKEGAWAYTNLYDEELYSASIAMRKTEPGDILGYMQRWIEFEKRFNEVLPMLPLYSNVYFDFFTNQLHNFQISENVTWGTAIVGSYLGNNSEGK